MSAPGLIWIGAGVSTVKRSTSGVMRSRFVASAKEREHRVPRQREPLPGCQRVDIRHARPAQSTNVSRSPARPCSSADMPADMFSFAPWLMKLMPSA